MAPPDRHLLSSGTRTLKRLLQDFSITPRLRVQARRSLRSPHGRTALPGAAAPKFSQVGQRTLLLLLLFLLLLLRDVQEKVMRVLERRRTVRTAGPSLPLPPVSRLGSSVVSGGISRRSHTPWSSADL